MAVEKHDPHPDEPTTTPAELGFPSGVYLTADGAVHDGTKDGYLAHGPHDRITHERARELGLIRPEPKREKRRR